MCHDLLVFVLVNDVQADNFNSATEPGVQPDDDDNDNDDDDVVDVQTDSFNSATEPGVQPSHLERATRSGEEQDRRKSVKLLNLATSFINQLFLVTLTRT